MMELRINPAIGTRLQVWETNNLKTAKQNSSVDDQSSKDATSHLAHLIPTNPLVLSVESRAKAESAFQALSQIRDLLENAKETIQESQNNPRYKGTERLLDIVATTTQEIIQHAKSGEKPTFQTELSIASPAIRAYQKNRQAYQNNRMSTENPAIVKAFRMANNQMTGQGGLTERLQKLSTNPEQAAEGIERAINQVSALASAFKTIIDENPAQDEAA